MNQAQTPEPRLTELVGIGKQTAIDKWMTPSYWKCVSIGIEPKDSIRTM